MLPRLLVRDATPSLILLRRGSALSGNFSSGAPRVRQPPFTYLEVVVIAYLVFLELFIFLSFLLSLFRFSFDERIPVF